MVAIELKPARNRAIFRSFEIVIDRFFSLFLEFQNDLVVSLDLIRWNIDNMVINENKPVTDNLPSLLTGGRETKLIHDIVQTAFKHLEQNGTGNTLGTHGFAEIVVELSFEHAINSFDLLLLAHL